jgi:hypothetical protein
MILLAEEKSDPDYLLLGHHRLWLAIAGNTGSCSLTLKLAWVGGRAPANFLNN